MKNRKKRSIINACIIAAMFITPLVVFAIMYSSGQRKNDFRQAEANIQVKEDDSPQDENKKDYTLKLDITNNYSVDKPVQIFDERKKNDEYIRVRFVPMWYDDEGHICASLNGISDFRTAKLNDTRDALLFCSVYGDTILTLKLDSFWENSWSYSEEDQCFYYSDVLQSGSATPALLSGVELSQAVYDEAEGYILQIDVLADAVQQYGDAKTNRQWNK